MQCYLCEDHGKTWPCSVCQKNKTIDHSLTDALIGFVNTKPEPKDIKPGTDAYFNLLLTLNGLGHIEGSDRKKLLEFSIDLWRSAQQCADSQY